jgi:predicted Abi (CAAX) family protease
VEILTEKLLNSLVTFPSLNNWVEIFYLLIIYAAIVLPIGFKTKFLSWSFQRSIETVTKILLTSLFTPAILEELFFRVLLLPDPRQETSTNTLYFSIAISLVLFVIYHPLNAITFFSAGRTTFFKPVFLLSAALLGLICTIAYLKSGSLWLAAFIHWIVVVIWLIFLGGYDRLTIANSHFQSQKDDR